MKLYSGPVSLFTSKVRIALDEKGIDYQRVEVGWSRDAAYEPHHPDVVALNPKQQVPILVDGDTVVYDSTLILEYLEDRYPDPPLYPSDVAERARCRQLEAFADEIVFAEVWRLIEQTVYEGGEADELNGAKEALSRIYEDLDKELNGRTFLCDRFSVADIGLHVMTGAAATLGAPASSELTHLGDWTARIAERPAAKRETEQMIAFFMSH